MEAKIAIFKQTTKTRKAVFLTMITTYYLNSEFLRRFGKTQETVSQLLANRTGRNPKCLRESAGKIMRIRKPGFIGNFRDRHGGGLQQFLPLLQPDTANMDDDRLTGEDSYQTSSSKDW
jgi:hypothetical protein